MPGMRQQTKTKTRTKADDTSDVPAGRFLICRDYSDWVVSGVPKLQFRLTAGLTTAQGERVPLTVELRFLTDVNNKRRKYVFSLLRQVRYKKERVFQLEISQPPKPAKDKHSASHEHHGEERVDVSEVLAAGRFDELLLYFCSQTKVEFRPPPVDPTTLVKRKR
jgi:hypothetical protein